ALQGKEASVLLLVPNGPSNPALDLLVPNRASIASVKFFGGLPAIPSTVRADIIVRLGIMDVFTSYYNITLSALADIEVTASVPYQGYSKADILISLDPDNAPLGSSAFYQFAVLSDGYTGMVSAAQIDSFIASTSNGRSGKLANTGAYFVEAANTYSLNEVYFLANAILESGWGTSQLAMGFDYPGGDIDGVAYPAGTYYNFFGIGAFDSSPLSGGRKMAVISGWDSPRAAILGGAQWISRNYIHPTVASAAVSGPQNTLYKMKWDVNRAVAAGGVWHQYATGRTWATGIAGVMANCYAYLDLTVEQTGLRFDIPLYR
ncbi:MAG: glucosaminidase domain-containing protein, partial [Coriobacteriales bacterium]|nr:glucosaminidase domain-containing protein [Coriobacteriales bacterium]